jgi:outer membrane biosynthesis protein TonB
MSASDSTTFVAGSTTFIVSAASAESATTLYVAPPTMAELMKEAFENMPDTLDTKKEIEEYFKNAMKDIVKAKKEAEPKPEPKKPEKRKTKKTKDADETDESDETDVAVKKPKKRKTKKDKDADVTDEAAEEKPKQPKKRKTKKDKDAETDESDAEEKPKPPKQPKRPLTKYQEFFKENYHKIDKAIPNKERCSKVAELWKIHKAELAEKAMDE